MNTAENFLSGLVVAVIEDDRLQLLAMEMLLGTWGCVPVVSVDAPGVLGRLREEPQLRPGLIISDFRLGGGANGLEVITSIRGVVGAEIPGLLVTGESYASLMDAPALPGVTVLSKPLSPARLRLAMGECLL